MKRKGTIASLKKIEAVIGTWDNDPDEIELDTVLAELRKIYNDVKYWTKGAPAIQEQQKSDEDIADNAVATVEDAEAKDVAVPGLKEVAREWKTFVDTPADILAEDMANWIPGVGEPEFIQPAAVESKYIKNESHADTLQKDILQNTPATVENVPAGKPKLGKKAILSLYDDEAASDSIPAEDNPRGSDITEDIDSVAGQPAAHPDAKEERQAPADTHKTVLGDVLPGNGQTLADAYARNNTTTDVASKISSGNGGGLRKSIGINDKFLMIRDMFGGSSEAYEAAIDELERFDDLDDALLHIHATYRWNPDSDGVKLLMDLLTRKLS